jgi:ketosteroid isomerase-like protein
MKKYFFCFVLLLAAQVNYAQTKDSLALVKAIHQLSDAMVGGDKAALYAITSSQLSYGHSGGAIENQEQFVTKISSGKSDFVDIVLTEQNIAVVGKTAIVRHKLVALTNDQGKPGQVQLKVLLVWQKERKKWVLLARQAIKLN